MSSTLPLPGKYIVNNLELISADSKIDVHGIFLELNIYEEIFSNFITGNIVLSDSNNLISGSKALPILGNEIVYINLSVPTSVKDSDSGENNKVIMTNIKFFGRVTGIRERRLLSEKNMVYVVDFIAEEAITSEKIRISKSYKGKPYYKIAQNLYAELGSTAQAFFEETKYSYNFICPNWHPLKGINWLASRSLSPKHNGSSFLYYHVLYDQSTQGKGALRSDKFYFRSVESMLDGPLKKKVYFNPKNLEPYSIVKDDVRFSNIDSYDIVKSFDIMENLDAGMYSSKTMTHDIINKKYSKTLFNYDKQFTQYKHADVGKISSKMVDSFGGKLSDYPDAVLRLYSNDKAMGTDNHIQEVIGSRLSILNSINNFLLKFSVPGDGYSSPGDLIEFNIPSPEHKIAFDTFYSGKYLVTSIRHHFIPEYYNMVFECAKESLHTEPQNYKSSDGVVGNYNG